MSWHYSRFRILGDDDSSCYNLPAQSLKIEIPNWETTGGNADDYRPGGLIYGRAAPVA